MRIFPADRERFVDLDILASLDAASRTECTGLDRIGKIGFGVVHFVRLGLERDLLMLDGHQFSSVMHRAITVVIVADGAVEHCDFQESGRNASRWRRLPPSWISSRRSFRQTLSLRKAPHQLAIHLDHAGVTALNGNRVCGVIGRPGEAPRLLD